MSDIPKADQYDTSAIDTHIKEIAKRERSITTGLRLKNLSQIVLWTSLAGFAFALIFILISYGIRLMIYPPPEKEFIERPIPSEVTLKLDEPLLVELNNETQDQRSMRNIEKNINPNQQNKIVSKFTKFHTIGVGEYTVTTGWNYENSNSRKPESEFCYTTSGSLGQISFLRHNIANKKGEEFTFLPNKAALIEEMNISDSLATDIINACYWSS